MKLLFCKECCHQLWEFGEPAYNVFIDICTQYLKKTRPVYLDENHEAYKKLTPVLSFLEGKNYIISTDKANDVIAVMPTHISHIDVEGEHFCKFCLDEEAHEAL